MNSEPSSHNWKWEQLPKSVDPQTQVEISHYQGCPYAYEEGKPKYLNMKTCAN